MAKQATKKRCKGTTRDSRRCKRTAYRGLDYCYAHIPKEVTPNSEFFNPFDRMSFSYDACFLCGTFLKDSIQSQEHVFPSWLQSRFSLWNKTVKLLNGTSIPYRNLKIPCCKKCNNEHLSKLEAAVSGAVRDGYEAVFALNREAIWFWMAKIFYGLLFQELNLLYNRKDPEAGFILDAHQIFHFRTLHYFLQGIRGKVSFENFFPGSVFVFKLDDLGHESLFDYMDNPNLWTIAFKLGTVGIIGCFYDNGWIKESVEEVYSLHKGNKLHPIQFDEISAIIFYNVFRLVREPRYFSVSDEETGITRFYWIPGYSTASHFKEWEGDEYIFFLEYFLAKWGYSRPELTNQNGEILTFFKTSFEDTSG